VQAFDQRELQKPPGIKKLARVQLTSSVPTPGRGRELSSLPLEKF
jgi:hypothetical protein